MKSILTLLVLFISLSASAQFDVHTGKKTGKTITIESKEYPVMVTTKGSEYIICNSPRTKNDYAVWIGKETDKTYEGKPVRQSKSGKYFIFVVSKNSNNPYCKYIKDEKNS